MPDALIGNLQYIASVSLQEANKAVFSSSAVFRYNTSTFTPLYKDRYIYPLIQLDRKVKVSCLQTYINQLKYLYKYFFRKIGINICFLEAKEVPYYAKYELYFITSEGDGCFTKLGMIYVLSDEFRKNLDMSLNEEFVDSGFSGRTLFKSIENASLLYRSFMIHPNVAPIDLMYACSHGNNTQVDAAADEHRLNAQWHPLAETAYRQWQKSGIPFYISYRNAVSLFFREKKGRYCEECFPNISSALDFLLHKKAAIVRETLELSEHLLEFSKRQLAVHSCEVCHKNFLYGFVFDCEVHRCIHCGKSIERNILNIDPARRFY